MDNCDWLDDLPLLTSDDADIYLYEKALEIAHLIRTQFSTARIKLWLLPITGANDEPCFLEKSELGKDDVKRISFHSKIKSIFDGADIYIFDTEDIGSSDMSYESSMAIYNSARTANVIYIDEKRSIKMENKEWVNNLPLIPVAQEDLAYGDFVKVVNIIKEKYSDVVLGLWLLADRGVEGEPCFVLRSTLQEGDIRDLELYRDINNCFEPIGTTIYDFSRFIIENENLMKTANTVYVKE